MYVWSYTDILQPIIDMTKITCPLNAHSSLSLYPIVRQDGIVQA